MRYVPNVQLLDLAITYQCTANCANCSALCTQAPAVISDYWRVQLAQYHERQRAAALFFE